MPPAAPRNMRGEGRAAAEAAQRGAVGQPLAQQQQQQGADGVAALWVSRPGSAFWPENSTSESAWPVAAA